MRYILILIIALAATITWQTSVVADNPAAVACPGDGVPSAFEDCR
jgi:hypothetical protein